jgi:MFS transporter, ACS family, pantothenate transporter
MAMALVGRMFTSITISIICGVITMPCGFYLFFVLPDYPNAKHKKWYLTEDEMEMARIRMEKVKRVQTNGLMNFKILRKIFSNWRMSNFFI